MHLLEALNATRDETLRCFELGDRELAARYAPGHSETGVRTLKDEFDKVAGHNEHHLRQIRSALGRA